MDHTISVAFGNELSEARVLHATPNVLLLEGELPPLPVGTPLRVALAGSAGPVEARLAATVDNGRYLVAIGSRAVRGAARVKVDLPAVCRVAQTGTRMARVIDLSSSGARLRGVRLAVGRELEVSFVPPGRRDNVRLRCVVVRAIEDAPDPEIGVTFSGGSLSFSVELTQQRMAAAAR